MQYQPGVLGTQCNYFCKEKKIKEGFPKEVMFDIVFFLQVEGSKVCPRIVPIY